MRQGRVVIGMSVVAGLLWGCMMGAPDPTRTPQSMASEASRVTPTLFRSAFLPPVTPVSQAEPRRCPEAPRSRLIVSERARVTNNDQALNIRSNPGTQYQQIGQMPPGAIFFVLGGPRCGGDYVWFYILYQSMEGWIAEGDENLTYAEPYLDG